MLTNIVSNSESGAGMSLATERPAESVADCTTSDRGLAGAFNANVIKLAKATIADKYTEQHKKGNVTIWNIGKKDTNILQSSILKLTPHIKIFFFT